MKSFFRSPYMLMITVAALALVILSMNVQAQDCVNGICKLRRNVEPMAPQETAIHYTPSQVYVSQDETPLLPVSTPATYIEPTQTQTVYQTPSYTVATTVQTRTRYFSRPFRFLRGCRR